MLLEKKRNRISFMWAVVALAVSVLLSSCSLGSMPSRTSSVKESSDITEDTEEPEDTDETEETTDESGIASDLKKCAEEYMQVLISGDYAMTAEKFNVRYGEVLPVTYECDKEFYSAFFTKLTYSYGSVLTTDYVDYSLNVTCEVPDYQACADSVLEDEEFMASISGEWVKCLAEEYGSGKSFLAYYDLQNSIVLEAMRRVEEGEFTEKQMITDSFVFHDNGDGTWVCRSTPVFAVFLSQESYMWRLTYMSPLYEYMLIARVGEQMVVDGTLKQNELDAVLDTKSSEIQETQ